MKKISLKKSSKLLTNRQFRAVLSKKCVYRGRLISLYVAANDLGRARLGVSVSKKVGTAVVRNRLKRLTREAFRLSRDKLKPADFLVIFYPKPPKKTKAELMKISLVEITDEFLALAGKG